MPSSPHTLEAHCANHPKRAEAVSFDRGESYRAVICGELQRPTFNARGPALIFAQQVLTGLRPAEPVRP